MYVAMPTVPNNANGSCERTVAPTPANEPTNPSTNQPHWYQYGGSNSITMIAVANASAIATSYQRECRLRGSGMQDQTTPRSPSNPRTTRTQPSPHELPGLLMQTPTQASSTHVSSDGIDSLARALSHIRVRISAGAKCAARATPTSGTEMNLAAVEAVTCSVVKSEGDKPKRRTPNVAATPIKPKMNMPSIGYATKHYQHQHQQPHQH
jgi:hypothetical protein